MYKEAPVTPGFVAEMVAFWEHFYLEFYYSLLPPPKLKRQRVRRCASHAHIFVSLTNNNFIFVIGQTPGPWHAIFPPATGAAPDTPSTLS